MNSRRFFGRKKKKKETVLIRWEKIAMLGSLSKSYSEKQPKPQGSWAMKAAGQSEHLDALTASFSPFFSGTGGKG